MTSLVSRWGRHDTGHGGGGSSAVRVPARRLTASLLVIGLAFTALVLTPADALADVRITGETTFPTETQVGDQDIPFRFTVENISTDPDRGRELILTEAGIIPACAEFVGTTCVQPEPDVFDLGTGPAAAVGVAGSCVGDTFTVEGPDAQGRYRVIPEQPVVLGPSDGTGPEPRLCTFEMLIEEVSRAPTTDVDPDQPGVQTLHQIDGRADDPATGEFAFFTRSRLVTVVHPTPTIAVDKTADPESRPEPGGTFTFSVEVTNTGPNAVTITSLTDDVYGDLNDPNNPHASNNTCEGTVGIPLDPAETYSCQFDGEFTGVAGDTETDVVTVTAESQNGQEATDSDDAVVTITPALVRPDLVVSALSDPPATRAVGTTFVVRSTTANEGDGAAAASRTRFYLSADQVRSVGDPLLSGPRPVPELDPGEEFTADRRVTIPTTVTPGDYHLIACADDTGLVGESDEANNCRATAATVAVTDGPLWPDLVVSALSDPPAARAPGTTFLASATTRNVGDAATGDVSKTRFYLSPEVIRVAGARLLRGARLVPELNPGAQFTGSPRVTVPEDLAPGVYYLIACADVVNAIGESKEGNNCRTAPGTVTVPPRPDLVVTTLSDPPASRAQGTTFVASATTRNVGHVSTGGESKTRFYLSPGDGTRRLLSGARRVPELAPGETFTGSPLVAVPDDLAPGTYYLVACADVVNEIGESDETNNCRTAARTMTVTAGP